MLKYKLIERRNPGDPSAPQKKYATHVKKGTKSVAAISKDIADISSLSRGDIQNTLMNLVDQIPKYLLDGNSVSLGELGTLRISFSSEGVDTEEEFNVSKIKGLKVLFTPGKLIKEEIVKAKFEK
ncbi:HU family DNA-binding protein [Labilibacter marinus]|uniref:HU family DNA-binding protein n=1 Tax=Labilibacter marinus TaxID=1477105 RepID=UPI000833E633|nr:HU family DNA-binding protein [Labilibacter marinus]